MAGITIARLGVMWEKYWVTSFKTCAQGDHRAIHGMATCANLEDICQLTHYSLLPFTQLMHSKVMVLVAHQHIDCLLVLKWKLKHIISGVLSCCYISGQYSVWILEFLEQLSPGWKKLGRGIDDLECNLSKLCTQCWWVHPYQSMLSHTLLRTSFTGRICTYNQLHSACDNVDISLIHPSVSSSSLPHLFAWACCIWNLACCSSSRPISPARSCSSCLHGSIGLSPSCSWMSNCLMTDFAQRLMICWKHWVQLTPEKLGSSLVSSCIITSLQDTLLQEILRICGANMVQRSEFFFNSSPPHFISYFIFLKDLGKTFG